MKKEKCGPKSRESIVNRELPNDLDDDINLK